MVLLGHNELTLQVVGSVHFNDITQSVKTFSRLLIEQKIFEDDLSNFVQSE